MLLLTSCNVKSVLLVRALHDGYTAAVHLPMKQQQHLLGASSMRAV
jgi:hypothetical protein